MKTLWGFKKEDIIGYDIFLNKSKNLQSKVIELKEDCLLIKDVYLGDVSCREIKNPNGIILLERKNREFKVGDMITFKAIDQKGQVIAQNPNQDFSPYLIELFDGFEKYLFPWMPMDYRNTINTRKWCSEKELKLDSGINR